jgi:DNA repair exonuclease SbcCD ATPase subunit
MLVKVTGTNFVRDTDSMALINTDIKEKNDYLAKVKMITNQKEELNKVRTEIDSIKDDMNDIKQMMKQLLEKG